MCKKICQQFQTHKTFFFNFKYRVCVLSRKEQHMYLEYFIFTQHDLFPVHIVRKTSQRMLLNQFQNIQMQLPISRQHTPIFYISNTNKYLLIS